jgi:hypothetical protein
MNEEDWYVDSSACTGFDPLDPPSELKYITGKYRPATIAGLVVDGCLIINVHEEGGCEGGGDHAEKMFGIFAVDADLNINPVPLSYFAVYGYYDSYNGTEWNSYDEWKFVAPKAKTVIDWV